MFQVWISLSMYNLDDLYVSKMELSFSNSRRVLQTFLD